MDKNDRKNFAILMTLLCLLAVLMGLVWQLYLIHSPVPVVAKDPPPGWWVTVDIPAAPPPIMVPEVLPPEERTAEVQPEPAPDPVYPPPAPDIVTPLPRHRHHWVVPHHHHAAPVAPVRHLECPFPCYPLEPGL